MANSNPTPIGGNSDGPVMADRGGFAALKDDQGRFRTQSLFWESRHPNYKPVFTTKKRDHEGCSSLYLKYMEIGDPTEYQVAIRLLGSWEHWQALNASKWFTELVTGWREELKIRMASERYWEMKEVANTAAGSPIGVQATKWLQDQYGERKAPKRGRPSKAEKEQALKHASEAERDLQEDAQFIGLVK